MADLPLPNPRVTFGVRYQDADMLIIEKPARVPTQPGKGHSTDTLLNGLFAIYAKELTNLGVGRDFGLLHRLDKDTSGLLVVALRPGPYDKLREDFAKRRIRKFYYALCDRVPKKPDGVIKLPIVESIGSTGKGAPKTSRVAYVGKPALTAYRVLASTDLVSLIEARPVTGRLHQVRVHLDAIGCAILGDQFYGPRRVSGAAPRLMLHAHRLVVTHPITGEVIDARAALPKDMRRVLRQFKLPLPGELAEAAAKASLAENADLDTTDETDETLE